MKKEYRSWGRFPPARHTVRPVFWRTDPLDMEGWSAPALPYGAGRSYGDCCLNDGGVLLDTTPLDRFIAFDPEEGVLRCEAGVTMDEILRLTLPKGWFLPVTPGTKFVTVGGAIANDVHGKNHHRAGSFGSHILRFELLRSDGERILCTPSDDAEWFRATVGGIGLTGLITWAELRLKRVANAFLDTETIRFSCLDEFFEISGSSDSGYEYTVAWVDTLARGSRLGRGLFFRGNHTPGPGTDRPRVPAGRRIPVPFDAPDFLLCRGSMRVFNFLYYHRPRNRVSRRVVHYDPFFYPLDAIGEWNRLYGRRGFFQYQCILPIDGGHSAFRTLMKTVADSGQGSFLAVLKICGGAEPPGMLSFPRRGVSLALDFPNGGLHTLALMDRLDDIVRQETGAVYLAKDARMSPGSFRAFYPRWEEFSRYVDPRFSSGLWRRVTGERAKEGN